MDSFPVKHTQVWEGGHVSKQVHPAMTSAFAEPRLRIQGCGSGSRNLAHSSRGADGGDGLQTPGRVFQPEAHLLSHPTLLTGQPASLRGGGGKNGGGDLGEREGRKDETWRNSRKEMKRTPRLSFFSCLSQLSDFAFKFKTGDQTARGTLYFCQETI